MTLLPQGLVARIAIGLAVALATILALRHLLEDGGATAARAAEAGPGAAAPGPSAPATPAHRALLATLAGRAERIVLADAVARVPVGAAPVVVIAAGGAVRIHRRPPPPPAPDAPWPLATVVLPAAALAALAPEERGALADVLAALAGRGPLPAQALSGAGFELDPAEVDQLLRWLR